MSVNFSQLGTARRLLMRASLAPLQGHRFQPTGFPDLGAATYQTPDGVQMLLVESAQSMANRLEAVCWDEREDELVAPLRGLPYVRVEEKGGAFFTCSLLEAHRLSSPYILHAQDKHLLKELEKEIGKEKHEGRVSQAQLARFLMTHDPNALIHGIFVAQAKIAGGRARLPRLLSGFIEASNVQLVSSGGVKKDDINPKGDAKKGRGHVPFHREEYTGEMTAYFNLDLAQLRAYGLSDEEERLLVALSLYKIKRFLDDGLRLRTACDLQVVGEPEIDRPQGYALPTTAELERALPELIAAASGGFSSPPVMTLTREKA